MRIMKDKMQTKLIILTTIVIVIFCNYISFAQNIINISTDLQHLTPTQQQILQQLNPQQKILLLEAIKNNGGVINKDLIEKLNNMPQLKTVISQIINANNVNNLTNQNKTSNINIYTAPVNIKKITSLFNKYLKSKSLTSPLIVNLNIKPFGLNLFSQNVHTVINRPVPPNYIVGPGDQIHIMLWGRINSDYTLEVQPDGTIYFPQVGPLMVAGMRYDKMQKFLRDQASRIIGAKAAITLTRLHTIQVMVLGEVQHPGIYSLSAMSTILDAVIAAGGPSKSGTIRNIELKRNNKLITKLDLYDLLLYGDAKNNKYLKQGDIIFIPTVGPLVGIAGCVKRPAIYELKNNYTLINLIKLAGGFLPNALIQNIQVERINNYSQKVVLDINATNKKILNTFKLRDGDLVKIFSIANADQNAIFLCGNVIHPGEYAYKDGLKLSDIIHSTKDLLPNTFIKYGYIRRLTAKRQYKYIVFNLKKFLANPIANNINLQPFDTILILNKNDVTPTKLVEIRGSVYKPGQYQFYKGMRISDLIKLAGGLTPYAYLKTAELTRIIPSEKGMKVKVIYISLKKALQNDPTANILLKQKDTLLIKNVPEWKNIATVEIGGQVKFPGKYVIWPGERLASLIKRAGGFTKRAYLAGAVFTRKSVQKFQQAQLNMMISKLQQELMVSEVQQTSTSLNSDEAKIRMAEMNMKRQFLAQLKTLKAKGRIVIHLLPLNKLKNSIYNIQLMDGDTIFIPQNPHTIQVIGSVYNQSAFIYQPGKDIDFYIKEAGGYTKDADISNIYVLKVDGRAVKPKSGILDYSWNPSLHVWQEGGFVKLQPGDTIVVPENLEKIPWMRNAKDITQLLYQIAVATGVLLRL